MRRRLVVMLVFALVLFALAPAVMARHGNGNGAHVAHLDSQSEVVNGETGVVDSDATGQAVFKLSSNGDELHYKLIVANIENVLMAHIHLAPAGANGPVVAWLYPEAPPPELIEGITQGVLATGTITADDLVGPLAGLEFSALVAAIESGNAYVNVHTVENPGGEIRGQIR